MRLRLVVAAVAITTTIVLAFCIPLARLVRDVARDQAIAAAERDAERIAGALSVTLDPDDVEAVISSTTAGGEDRLGVVLPDGSILGSVDRPGGEIDLARSSETWFTVDQGDAFLVLAPVELAEGVAVVRVRIPASESRAGVAAAWGILTGVAAVLLVAALLIADRLATSVTRPAVALAEASRRVADGDLTVRVSPAGPPELERAARGFNDLTGRLTDLVAAERRDVADLAHRLRTPLAVLQLEVEAVEDADARVRLSGDVAELERAVDLVISEARRPIRQAVSPISDLADVTRDRVAFWSVLADEQLRRWEAEIDEVSLPVRVPREELEAAVDALLDNVFTHTPPGTGFAVSVRSIPSGRARLVVRDEGPGFEHVEPAEPSDGRTGIGLDIAARAVQAAGGTLDTHDDGGAVVVVELPLVGSDATVPPTDGRRHRIPHRRSAQRPA